jgi:hypothetical protein
MKRFLLAALAAGLFAGVGSSVRADEAEAKAVLETAMNALGGEAKLTRGEAFSRKAKGTISIQGNENDITTETTYQALERYRNEFEGEFNGNKVKGVVVVNGDKGWRKFGDNKTELDVNGVTNEKRNLYLQVVPITIVPLKGNGFKATTAAEETVGGKPAAVLKFTGPDGKDFTLAFDKENGLPVRLVATVVGFGGQEFSQEMTYTDYKDFDGIKRATKIESKRNGESFLKQEITEFKVLEKANPKTFAEPE